MKTGLQEGQQCYLHHASEESQIFEFGTEAYQEAVESGWTHARQAHNESKTNSGGVGVDMPEMFEDENIKTYKKNTVLEVIGVFVNGDIYAQNKGDASDRWRIPKDTFAATYDIEETNKLKDIIKTGFEMLDLSNTETLDTQLKTLDLFTLRTLCIELKIENMEKANGATCIKYIKEYASKK